jgi:choice-of-anchor B domain-containing protein
MRSLFLFFCLFSFFAKSQYIQNISLLDVWKSDTLLTNSSNVRYSSCWGFERSNKEYAILGSTEGAHFFELSSDNKLNFIDFIPGRYVSSQAITREYKTYRQYAYAVGDEGLSSLQIIDLSYLPDSVQLVNDLQNNFFGKTHNLFIDTTNALLYLCSVKPIVNGVDQSLIPLCVFSLADPINPSLIWSGPSDIDEVHDIFVRDNLAILNCGYEGLRIYDFSQANQPQFLSNLEVYPDQGYNHQGWLSPDNSTYVFADENAGLRIKKCSLNIDYSLTIENLFESSDNSFPKTPHNIQITNDFAFVAYYNDGLRIFDLRTEVPVEIAAFDTYVDEPGEIFSMWGAWGIYALYSSERIIVSDRKNGLFLFDFDRTRFLKSPPSSGFTLSPNPCYQAESVFINIPSSINSFSFQLFDANGKLLEEIEVENSSSYYFNLPYKSGVYFIHLQYTNYLNEAEYFVEKMVLI